jgi:hypothetical protein
MLLQAEGPRRIWTLPADRSHALRIHPMGPEVRRFRPKIAGEIACGFGEKRWLTGKRSGLIPPPLRKRGRFSSRVTDAADSRARTFGFLANCPRMFDIVSGRETRAAVLLAASPADFGPMGCTTTRRFAFFWKASSIPLSFGWASYERASRQDIRKRFAAAL